MSLIAKHDSSADWSAVDCHIVHMHKQFSWLNNFMIERGVTNRVKDQNTQAKFQDTEDITG